MGTDEKFNGWANHETWALMLHINNDQGLHEEFRDLVREVDEDERRDAVKDRVETYLDKDEFEREFGVEVAWPIGLRRMAEEVGSRWRIDWNEVVNALLED